MDNKLLKSVIIFLTIARTFNCKNHIVCDAMGNPLTIEEIANIIKISLQEFKEILKILEMEDLIVISGRKTRNLTLDIRLNGLLQQILTKDEKYWTRDIRLFRINLRFSFHLLIRTMIELYFRDGTIVNSENDPVCLREIAEKININSETLSKSFNLLDKIGILKLDSIGIGSAKKTTISEELYNELKYYINCFDKKKILS